MAGAAAEPIFRAGVYQEQLKTEKRQLESFHALTNAHARFLPIATQLLSLRGVARAARSETCTAIWERQIHLLSAHTTRPKGAPATNEQICLALAELGGQLRRNGPPGWIILGRAIERLFVLKLGWIAHENARRDVIDD